jgi:hypothetical protein
MLGEEDEQDLVLAKYYVSRKLGRDGEHSRSSSATSDNSAAKLYGEPQHARSTSANGGLYGGGAMPGPQYLLNMHPGVPVHRW